MDGIINFNKPLDISSARALDQVRTVTGVRKSGHAGTLDPRAVGVLVLCLGRATKLVERIMEQTKVYRTTARLDVTSTSYDLECELIPVPVREVPTSEAVRAACGNFEGTIEQVPPATSAIKIRGVPAYRRHSRGQSLTISPRPVRIHWLHVHRYQWPEIDLEICSGRGTYVRALIRDLGERLGVGGCLTSLCRTQVGPFHLRDSWTRDRMRESTAEHYLIDLDRARASLESVTPPPRPDDLPVESLSGCLGSGAPYDRSSESCDH